MTTGFPYFPQDSTLESLLEGLTNPDVIDFIKSDYAVRKAGVPGLFFELRKQILSAQNNPDPNITFEQAVDGAIATTLAELTNNRIHDCRFMIQEYIGDATMDRNGEPVVVENTRPVRYAVPEYWALVNS